MILFVISLVSSSIYDGKRSTEFIVPYKIKKQSINELGKNADAEKNYPDGCVNEKITHT